MDGGGGGGCRVHVGGGGGKSWLGKQRGKGRGVETLLSNYDHSQCPC